MSEQRDRERSAQRPDIQPNPAPHVSLAFLPNLFGRRASTRVTTGSQGDARKASASSSVTRTSFDESRLLASPLSASVQLPPIGGPPPSSSSGAPFHLDAALALMQPGATKSSAELVEIVKATSVHLANALIDHSEDKEASPPPLTEIDLRPEDIRTLYERAIEFCAPSADYGLRTAAIRLLAVLLGAAPPPESVLDPNPAGLPPSVTRRAIFRLITTPTNHSPGAGAAYTNQIFVEVAALKALTREGTIVNGLDGIVGWLLHALGDLTKDWLTWCAEQDDSGEVDLDTAGTPFAPIKSASPAPTAQAIIDLIESIVQQHSALFAPADLTHVVRPMLQFVWRGIIAAVSPSPSPPSRSTTSAHSTLVRHNTPHHAQPATTHNSPAGAGRPSAVQRSTSLTVGRVAPFPMTSARGRRGDGMNKSPGKSPARLPRIVKWMRPFQSVCQLVYMLFETTTMNDDLFDEIFELVCFAFGQDAQDAMMDVADTGIGAHELVRQMLGLKSGRRGELALYNALEGKLVLPHGADTRNAPDVDRKIVRGAVIVARLCLEDKDFVRHSGSLALSFSRLAPSLVAALSTSRFPGTAANHGAEWAKWAPVDTEILTLLDTHLSALEAGGADAQVDDAWEEGEAACDILDGILPLIQQHEVDPARARSFLKSGDDAIVSQFENIQARVPVAIGRLHTRLHTSSHQDLSSSPSAPAPFYHPKFIALQLELGAYLDEEAAGHVIDYYQRECLCLPFTTGWIKNIWKLLEAFAMSYELPVARARVSNLLYHDVYVYVTDLPEHRDTLVEEVIVPYARKWLPSESDDGIMSEALEVLVSAAVSETMEKDDERRRARATKEMAELEEEDAAALPTEDFKAAASGGSFDAIREILIKIAVESRCRSASGFTGSHVSVQSAANMVELQRKASDRDVDQDGREGRSRETSSNISRLIRTLSPARIDPARKATDPAPPMHAPDHRHCRGVEAVHALIAIFTRLAFSAPQAVATGVRPVRTPASARCITIYRDLLALLYPMNDSPGRLPARCPRARLTILQWSMRLRADRKHRIIFRSDINRFVQLFAGNLFRTKEAEDAVRTQLEAEEARRKARAAAQTLTPAREGRGEDERGRSARTATDTSTRSRSRSKAAGALLRTTSTDTAPYNPLWRVPETLAFECPPDNHPSEGMTTYDPHHPSLTIPGAPAVEGVWLPVSDYVRVLNGILRWEHDWELVSYVLVFLPQQLGNKHFFHGKRATDEIKKLLDVLCDGILETDNRWERRFHVPSFIKRTHINSAAYQAISILISYRSVFSRVACDRLIQSLAAGLESHPQLAKPCLQALTICIYELGQYLSKHLLTILQKMQQIVSTSVVAVHILEFLVALGNSTLYRNFTDSQYRLVFAVAIGYIAEHNARTDQSVDFANSKEGFTLSQHVIGLAYHVIYLWFMAIKVTHRTAYVGELVKGLTHAKSQRQEFDERTEVCFDWLARYAYGNADPKPATSFLQEIVMRNDPNAEPPKTQSWLLGGALVTITSHQRSGWATITTTRATGQTSVVCKLENVPLLELGEDCADLASLPAFLMANRERKRDVNDQVQGDEAASPLSPVREEGPGVPDPRDVVSLKSPPPAETSAEAMPPSGYVWSGATPSQRRKDVVIEPSYLALGLLSSYPNTSMTAPRGRIIPKEPKFDRALRGIDMTPVINTFKIAVLYVGPGQSHETEIFGNIDGSPLYLDFLAGLGRIIKLKGQVDIYTGGLDREDDTDGKYAYAWWDDLAQMIFHVPTLMPNVNPEHTNKKRLVGNDYVKIVYNESGADFQFDTVKTQFNFVNIVISPYATRDVADAGSLVRARDEKAAAPAAPTGPAGNIDEWGGDSEDFFKVVLQRRDGIPEFSPVGEYKLVSRRNLPTLVRQMAHYANQMAERFQHVQAAADAEQAEYITIWRTRYRALGRLRDALPPLEDTQDKTVRETLLRDFTRIFSPPAVEPVAK